MNVIKIGTRKSPLALWQAHWVRDRLSEIHPGLEIELIKIQTLGDKILDSPLSKIGDKGLFTRDIEVALLEKRIDLAVHSLKDLPTVLPEGLEIGTVTEREDPRDALVTKSAKSIAELPEGCTIATSSLRRHSQLLHLRPDLLIVDVRGNVGTRIQKFKDAAWEGIVMAHAGLLRMELGGHVGFVLEPEEMLPAVSQGALGIEIREGDEETASLIECLEHAATRKGVTAERAFLHRLEGGCQIPVAALGKVDGNKLELEGLVASLNGRDYYRDRIEGAVDEAESLGITLAEKLLDRGAGAVLEKIRNA